MEHITHTIAPVYNVDSKVLILGTLPSVKSREGQFYYHHPQNRFWKIIAAITKDLVPTTIEEKKELLLQNNIAVWDVIQSCDIEGSSDSSIRNVIPADISQILTVSTIKQIYTNGTKAHELYEKYCYPTIKKRDVKLPSSSPANAKWSLEHLVDDWGKKLRNN